MSTKSDVEVNREVLEDLRVLEGLFIWRELIAGEQERDRRLILISVVSGTFLKRTAL